MKTKMVVVNPLNSIRFVGSLTAGSQRQAWFVNTKTNEEFVVEELGSVEFGGLAVRVHAITNDFVEIRVNDQPARIDIGQLLAK